MDAAEIARRQDEVLDNVRTKLEEFQARDQQLLESVSSAIEKFPFQGPVIRAGYDELVKLRGQVQKGLIRIFTNPGNPAALAVAAEKWHAEISEKLDPLIFAINGEQKDGTANVDADEYWDGPAAARYGKVKGRQVEGLRALSGTADTMQSGLEAIAWAIIAFWTTLLVATIQALVGFIAGIVAIPATAGASLAVSMAALVAFATVLGALATATIALLTAFETFETALEQNTGDKATFGSDVSWPAAPSLKSDW